MIRKNGALNRNGRYNRRVVPLAPETDFHGVAHIFMEFLSDEWALPWKGSFTIKWDPLKMDIQLEENIG